MKAILILIIINFLIFFPLHAQLVIHGEVLSLKDKKPVSFANIGIVYTSVGTLSNEDGSFAVKISNKYIGDTLVFSALGFGKTGIPVSGLSEDSYYTIYLKESATLLRPVLITGEKWKGKKYRTGNRRFEGSCIYADTVTAGSAMALKINCHELVKNNQLEFPVFIKDAQVTIVNNTFKEFKIRTRINEVDPVTGLPGKDLLNESVITRSSIRNGKLTVDLSKYNIQISQDFFLTFEWIFDKDDRDYLFQQYETFKQSHPDKVGTDYIYLGGERVPYTNYRGNLYAGPSFGISLARKSIESHVCYYRLNSLGKWNRSLFILAANVILGDQPAGVKSEETLPEITSNDLADGMMPYYKADPLSPAIESAEFNLDFMGDTTFFSQRIREPVSIIIHRINNRILFYAHNHSPYRYQLELNFDKLRNLLPIITKKSFVLDPGRRVKPLIYFDVADATIPNYHYDLAVRESIGDTAVRAELMYPYLIPVGNSRKANIMVSRPVNAVNYYRDIFKMNAGDTVFAMRKGRITASPKMDQPADRISSYNTLEILHSDGTVMVYYNLDPESVFVRTGENILPGQPVGVINSISNLEVELYRITNKDRLIRMPIYYFTGKSRYVLFRDIQNNYLVAYPDSIITKELSEEELRIYKRKRL